ncbi:hypothetical protein [Tamlana sp. I1]|uniref:hypothetical protein n=1 Tax=Tamlana sp. I1 TaxID=2762061 RepID=UPI00188E9BF2|nr:hypothetical protein [Tamlana sp. I1]
MKNLIILSTICLTLLHCTVREQPRFIGLENIQVLESNSEFITLSADALFINPNDIDGELSTNELKIFVNNKNLATIENQTYKVPAKKEFSIALTSKIPTDSLINTKNLVGLIDSFMSKTINVQYKGEIVYKVLGISKTYVIDKSEEIKINL